MAFLKINWAMLCLIISTFNFATADEMNPFVHKADTHFKEYLAFEINHDLQKAVDEYNNKRKNPDLNLLHLKILKLDQNKIKELPPIKKKDNYYLMEYRNQSIKFDARLILLGVITINGKEIKISSEVSRPKTTFLKNNSNRFSLLINLLISNSIAEEVPSDYLPCDEKCEAFKNSNEVTRTMLAGLLNLADGYEKLGLFHLCLLECKERVSNANRQKIRNRIKQQTAECEKNIEMQANSIDSYDRYKDFSYLKQINDTEFKQTHDLITKMSKLQKDKDVGDTLDSAFDSDMAGRKSCFDIVRGTYMLLAHDLFALSTEKEKANEDARAFCAEIDGLKKCLAVFHTQAKSIEGTSKREYKKVFKFEPPKVPDINNSVAK